MLASARDRTPWMQGRWGLMVHWLYPQTASRQSVPPPGFDAAVDAFDLDGFLADFAVTGGDWMMFTIGQNTGYYAGPNAVLERLVGPGHASRRDLVGEMAEGLKRLGKRFIPYLPSEVAAQADAVRNGFAWDPADQSQFQRRYTDFIRDYSLRLGTGLDAWWFDGCYDWDLFNNRTYDWPLWVGASRAGNPDAAVAFNDGSFYLRKQEPVTPYQDYLSGEIGWLENGRIRLGRETEREGPGTQVLPTGRFVPGTHCQWHGQLPIDCFWLYGGDGPMDPPRYSDAELNSFVKSCLAVGGAVTLNVGIYREGRLAEKTVAQLARLSRDWNDARYAQASY